MKNFLKAGGIIMMLLGIGSVLGSVEPMPETPLWFTIVVGTVGFILMWCGYAVYIKGEGEPFMDPPWRHHTWRRP